MRRLIAAHQTRDNAQAGVFAKVVFHRNSFMRNGLCAGNATRAFPADTRLAELTIFVLFTGTISDLISTSALVHFADSSQTFPDVRDVQVADLRCSQNAAVVGCRLALLLPQWDRPPIMATVLDRVVVIPFPAAAIV
jgi:hypothetical protein